MKFAPKTKWICLEFWGNARYEKFTQSPPLAKTHKVWKTGLVFMFSIKVYNNKSLPWCCQHKHWILGPIARKRKGSQGDPSPAPPGYGYRYDWGLKHLCPSRVTEAQDHLTIKKRIVQIKSKQKISLKLNIKININIDEMLREKDILFDPRFERLQSWQVSTRIGKKPSQH